MRPARKCSVGVAGEEKEKCWSGKKRTKRKEAGPRFAPYRSTIVLSKQQELSGGRWRLGHTVCGNTPVEVHAVTLQAKCRLFLCSLFCVTIVMIPTGFEAKAGPFSHIKDDEELVEEIGRHQLLHSSSGSVIEELGRSGKICSGPCSVMVSCRRVIIFPMSLSCRHSM